MAICETCDYANRPPYKSPCSECDKTMGSPFCCYEHEEKPTNADRIRAMSDEELAQFLADEIPHGDCYGCDLECATFEEDKFNNSCQDAFYRWLKQPAE